jgi:tol-pal system protein YbgF
MRGTRVAVTSLLAAVTLAMPASAVAQNREQQQMYADMRQVEELVQQLRLQVTTLSDQLKAANAKLDAQAEASRKQAADTAQVLKDLSTSVENLRQRVEQNSTQVNRVGPELQSLRDGFNMLATQLSQMSQNQAPPASGDPNAPAGANPPAGGGASPATLPGSPLQFLNAARNYYGTGKFDLAIAAFRDFVAKFPDSPDAPEAQFYIGMSQYQSANYKDALASFVTVVDKYKNVSPLPSQVPDAYYQQAQCYEQLAQRADAIRTYQLVHTQFPGSNADALATQALRRLGRN